ncbi:MAG: DUF4430 domain-containing protein [Clostridia bacterium]
MKNFKNKKLITILVAVALVVAITCAIVAVVVGQTKKDGTIKATLSIDCATVLKNYDKLPKELQNEKYVPKDGIILKETTFYFSEGETAYDVILRATRKKKIHIEFSESSNFKYIKGLNQLYEKNCGDWSGWMFKINGEFASVACDKIILKENDKIEILYSCDGGQDLGMVW